MNEQVRKAVARIRNLRGSRQYRWQCKEAILDAARSTINKHVNADAMIASLHDVFIAEEVAQETAILSRLSVIDLADAEKAISRIKIANNKWTDEQKRAYLKHFPKLIAQFDANNS